MDAGGLKETVREIWGKYRWAALILAVGLLLMLLPEGESPKPEETVPARQQSETLQQELENVLALMEGAGQVRVLLSAASGAESHYQTDEDRTESGDSADWRLETVVITGADRGQQGLLRRVDPPRYRGAVILCQGADRPAVRLKVVEAVAAATGLTTDKISVLKMN